MEYTVLHNRRTAVVSHLFLAIALILLCLGASQPVRAGTWNIVLNGKAIHLTKAPADVTYNENNLGAGFQYDFDEIGGKWVPFIAASGFKDSFKHDSYNAGGGTMRRFKFGNGWHFDAGVYAFAMTRKDYKNNSPFLGILPVASIGTDMISLNMTYIPKVRPKFAEIIFLQLKINTQLFN